MNDEIRTRILNIFERHRAIVAGWAQLDPAELAALLRAAPPRVRGRLLSHNRTPSSKMSATTARLLVTNVARRGSRERLRVASVLTNPLVRDAEDAIEEGVRDGGNVLDALAKRVDAQDGKWGSTVVVFGAVAGVYDDPERMIPWFAACAQAGLLTGDLSEAAAELGDITAALLERAAADVAAEKEGEILLAEIGVLRHDQRDAAAASARIAAAVAAGELIADADVAVIDRYNRRIAAEAERAGSHAAIAAIEAAVAAMTSARGLRAALSGLAGPAALDGDIAEVLDALDHAADDPPLAERLRRFAELVAAADPMERFALAGELRGLPRPPASALLDAALAGLLRTGPADDTEATDAQAPSGPSDAASPAGEATSDEQVAEPSVPRRDDRTSEAEPESAADAETSIGAIAVAATLTEAEAAVSDSAAAALVPSPAEAQAGPPVTVDERPDSEEGAEDAAEPPFSDVTAIDAPVARLNEAAPARPGTGPEASGPAHADVVTTLTELLAAQRYGLAHHMALALGQDYRAEILAEAALAAVVRGTSSPAAADMVARAAQMPLNPADTGSVLLRVAALLRVALLDHASGAPVLLRSIAGPLEGFDRVRDLALAVATATERNLSVPATGVVLDIAEAVDQAHAIASWAEDTLSRPPRHNRLFRGIEIWKDWTSRGGRLERILAVVASNNAELVAEVRELCAPLARRSDIGQQVEAADRALREGRAGRAQKIIGPARDQLVRNVGEIIEQALAWCDAHDAAKGGWSSSLRNELANDMLHLRHPVAHELYGLAPGSGWSAAAARAAATSLDASCGLLANEPLRGAEVDPVAALNRSLTLIDGFHLDVDLRTPTVPTVGQLVEAARRSRPDAFKARLAARDFVAAEVILDLSYPPDAGFDESEARRQLNAAEREARIQLAERWTTLDARFAAARARGRIAEDDASRLHGALLQAQPDAADGPRRDLGVVAEELADITARINDAIGRRRDVVTADVQSAIADGAVRPAWVAKLTELLARDELGAAEEYLHWALAGGSAPDDAESEAERLVDLAGIPESWPAGIGSTVADAVATGSVSGPIDFASVSEISRSAIADALRAWLALSRGARPENLERVLNPVLRLLGLIPTKIARSPETRAASTRGRWFIDVHGDKSGTAFVPDYGSRSQGRRRFMLCWDTELPVSQMWDLAAANALADQPVYVLWMGMLSTQARILLAQEARRRASGDVVVIDDAVLVRCAEVGRQAWDVTMRAVLPYASPNPYDPDLLVNTPEEMFYGRRAERQKVAQLAGTSFISGGRRLGKSALLRSVQQSLEGTDVVALLVVIQHVAAVPPHDPEELWPVLSSRLIEAGVLPIGTGGTGDAVAGGIRAWRAANPERRLLLLLDECDFFLRADSGSRFRNVVLLRDLMSDAGGRFKVVFSGLQHVARYRKLPNQPLSHLPQPLVIGPLDPASAANLVQRPLHAIGWNIAEPQVDRIVTFCACNPSVLQLACGQLLERLRRINVTTLAPWEVPDDVLNELLRSPELEKGVRDRLFLTLELDHRYKLLAYLLAWRATSDGLGSSIPTGELRHRAIDYWPEGFVGQNLDDVRALCDELVGLGVFAGDAEAGYRMLSPATVRLFGTLEDITDELLSASESYEPDVTAGAAGHRIAISEGRFSPLTAGQLADVVGQGRTQLRIVVGSRALRADSVPDALAAAAKNYRGVQTLEVASLKAWRDAMVSPSNGHLVVVADMTVGVSRDSWEQSIDTARRRGATRSGRGTRAAVLVAGPSERWLLDRLVTDGDLADVAVGLRRVDLLSLKAWDRIAELDLAHPARQKRLLEVTGGWPLFVERVIARMRQRSFDAALAEVQVHLLSPEGARELIAAAGLDRNDLDQPADSEIVTTFARLAETGWREPTSDLVELLTIDEHLDDFDVAGAVAAMTLLGFLDPDDDGRLGPEPVLARCMMEVGVTARA